MKSMSISPESQPQMQFKYVILDEAGAMLEPDVVGTIIHGCQFLLSVGDHLQVCSTNDIIKNKCRSLDVS